MSSADAEIESLIRAGVRRRVWRRRHRRRVGLAAVVCAALAGSTAGVVVRHRDPGQVRDQRVGLVSPPAPGRATTFVTGSDGAVPSPEIERLRMFGETTGWALVDVGRVRKVYRTVDGGDHWAAVHPPTNGVGFSDVFFLDWNRAWLSEPIDPKVDDPRSFRLVRTLDGGRSWATIVARGRAGLIRFADERHGWGFDTFAAAGPKGASVYRTTDKGRTWKVVGHYGLPLDQGLPDNLNVAGGCNKTRASFSGASTGWIAGAGAAPCYPDISFLVSRDGGRTWNAQRLPKPTGVDLAAITSLEPPDFDTTLHGFATVEWSGQNESGAGIYVTADGGGSWAFRSLPAPGNVDFVNGGNGWLLTGIPNPGDRDRPPRHLYRTFDDGRTWTNVETSLDLSNAWQIDFVTATVGFATIGPRQSAAVRTRDAGMTWTRLPLLPR